MNKRQVVSVIGLGYIGLPTAALVANAGYEVLAVDSNVEVVNTLNNGEIHIIEPKLDILVRKVVESGKLKISVEPQVADVYIICVPTPFYEGADIYRPNIEYILAAVNSIVSFLKKNDLIILESTSPVGTTKIINQFLKEKGVDVDAIQIAYCPERVLPGNVLAELIQNDRIIGGLTPVATKIAADFYRSFVAGGIHETNAETAELCKLTENSYRDLNIAFANELSLICSGVGVDVWELLRLANMHPRVNILSPGIGVGGHCIAVDPWFIVDLDSKNSRLIRTAREVNDGKTLWVTDQIINKVNQLVEQGISDPKIACLGLAFKPNIDDLRESPAVRIVERLQSLGYNLIIVEPNISSHPKFNISSLSCVYDEADLIIPLVRHHQFVEAYTAGFFNKFTVIDFCGIGCS